jgi:hypothetical protein
LIADGSGSMWENNGEKVIGQKKAFLIILEALKKLQDNLILNKHKLSKDLDVQTK